ncbi:MAG: FtsW/RodA/SpoVE family cell cycle protein, partial [Lachnospiraceae bacterium]|nr:FtsW/RodA/SpoVE family cell cycle protein [Lachnospiraceae bacterium]
FKGYRLARIDVWKDIENTPGGYQILQGLYAIASGGWFGKGLGNSIQKLGYIPEVHTDMIFTCIVEELGIVGGLLLICVYIILLIRIYKIAVNAPDLFGSLICVGVFVQIALQAILNIAVVTNTIPSTGIPLPFISYGGSSLAFLMLEMGLVLNVSNQIDYNAQLPQ